MSDWVFPLSLLSVGGRKAIAVEQKPWRRCLLPSVEPRRGGGIFPKLKCVAGPNREQRHPPPRRRALGVLVRVDGVWSAGLTGGQHGVRTLQGRIDCVPTHAAHAVREGEKGEACLLTLLLLELNIRTPVRGITRGRGFMRSRGGLRSAAGKENGWLLFTHLKPKAEGYETEILTKLHSNPKSRMRKPQIYNFTYLCGSYRAMNRAHGMAV